MIEDKFIIYYLHLYSIFFQNKIIKHSFRSIEIKTFYLVFQLYTYAFRGISITSPSTVRTSLSFLSALSRLSYSTTAGTSRPGATGNSGFFTFSLKFLETNNPFKIIANVTSKILMKSLRHLINYLLIAKYNELRVSI